MEVDMDTVMHDGRRTMQQRQVVRLGDASGLRVACEQGTLWITIDGELRDIVLEPGEGVTIASHADTLVQALRGPARLHTQRVS